MTRIPIYKSIDVGLLMMKEGNILGEDCYVPMMCLQHGSLDFAVVDLELRRFRQVSFHI